MHSRFPRCLAPPDRIPAAGAPLEYKAHMETMTLDVERTVAMANLGIAALSSAMAYPLFRGMVARNGYFGFRTAKSMASDQAWLQANRLFASCLMVGASIIAVLNGAYVVWGFPLPTALHDDVLMYSAPVGLMASGLVAWLLHQRQ